MACFAPISGSFPHYAARWVDPAFGFAVGWNFWLNLVLTVPAEISGATILLGFWDPDLEHGGRRAGIMLGIIVVMCMINVFGVRWFGESEVFFSAIKSESYRG